MDNLAVISIQPECMKQKITSFDVSIIPHSRYATVSDLH